MDFRINKAKQRELSTQYATQLQERDAHRNLGVAWAMMMAGFFGWILTSDVCFHVPEAQPWALYLFLDGGALGIATCVCQLYRLCKE